MWYQSQCRAVRGLPEKTKQQKMKLNTKLLAAVVTLMLLTGTSAKVVKFIEIDELDIEEHEEGAYEADYLPFDAVSREEVDAQKELKFPKDCECRKLVNFAEKCGLKVTSGAKHYIVKDNNHQLTTIPRSVKANGTCRSIINTLNARCT